VRVHSPGTVVRRLLSCTELDIDEFEDNPEEFIRKDIEKSGERRHAAPLIGTMRVSSR
jgi:hypothetical protein